MSAASSTALPRSLLYASLLYGLLCNACTPSAAVKLHDVIRIEIAGRFVRQPGLSPTVDRNTTLTLEGTALARLVDIARCRSSNVVWKGGLAAVLTMRDGRKHEVSGFSFYGGFLRIHNNQWCQFDEETWEGIWNQSVSPAAPVAPARAPISNGMR